MRLTLDPTSLDDYATFLKVKSLPSYSFCGRTAIVPGEYAHLIDDTSHRIEAAEYTPHPKMFDYQRDIVRMAIGKRRFSIFADCGLGKTLMFLDYAQHVADELPADKRILIVSPLMVINQTIDECDRWYKGSLDIGRIPSSGLQDWLDGKGETRIGITNYDALSGDDVRKGCLGCLILDESSMLKSHYGKWGGQCLRLGQGLDWVLACTGTPAPNDRIEYANHAVLMGAFPSVNSFLARFFVNRGQTNERWEIKHHALGPFYRELSHWCIFLTNPATYGWKDNTKPLPPIVVHRHHIDLTPEQQTLAFEKTGTLFADKIGGITGRSVLSQIAKGSYRGQDIPTHKPQAIADLIASWPDESTIVWCIYNREQEVLERMLPDAGSMTGATPIVERERIIADFKAGRIKTIISKPKILGFGLNLQIATRQVFSGLQDSYESYYQAVKRSNRFGAKHPLNVHIPYTDIEFPMIETVMRKAERVQRDTEEQERIFKNATTH